MTVEVRYGGRAIPVAAGETVLAAVEKAGLPVPASCRAGVCQSCAMRVVDGPVPPRAQDGLKESHRQSGHFLACVAKPEASFSCEPASVAPFKGRTTIRAVTPLGADVFRVRLARPVGLTFAAGQFVTLTRDDGLARSYSIASRADEPAFFDLHVRRIPNGRMSGWLCGDARPGAVVALEGPKGDCSYYPGHPEEALLLAGTGTGIAPLHAIADEALRQRHTGPIVILQGGTSIERLYFVDELEALAARSPNVKYAPCVLQDSYGKGVLVGDLGTAVLAAFVPAAKQRVYLCGDEALVRGLKRKLFLAGASLKKLHADPFIGAG